MKKNNQKELRKKVIPEESFIQKWKAGITNIPPIQLTKIAIRGTWITLIGVIVGLGVSIFYYKTLWWLCIVLLGAALNTIVTLIGQYQQLYSHQKVMETFTQLNIQEIKNTMEEENGL